MPCSITIPQCQPVMMKFNDVLTASHGGCHCIIWECYCITWGCYCIIRRVPLQGFFFSITFIKRSCKFKKYRLAILQMKLVRQIRISPIFFHFTVISDSKSLALERSSYNLKLIIFKHLNQGDILSISCGISSGECHRRQWWLVNIGAGNGLPSP